MSNSLADTNHRSGLHLQLPTKLIDINARDIEELALLQRGPEIASIMLKLKPSVAARLYTLTENAVGQQIAWIWNGRVLSMETLQAPIGRDLTVHNFSSFEAEDFKRMESSNGAVVN